MAVGLKYQDNPDRQQDHDDDGHESDYLEQG